MSALDRRRFVVEWLPKGECGEWLIIDRMTDRVLGSWAPPPACWPAAVERTRRMAAQDAESRNAKDRKDAERMRTDGIPATV